MNLTVKNISYRDIIYEFFLPIFDICGIKMTPMVGRLMSGDSHEVHVEYFSSFKKLGAFSL